MLERWKEWIAAFDAACDDDQWERLTPYLTDDVIYIVSGVPYACELRGKEAVINGFAKSIRHFDQRFDHRIWESAGTKVWEPNGISTRVCGTYLLNDKPPLRFSAFGQWFFRGDRISAMIDTYDLQEAETLEAFNWLAAHGEGLDPSYC